MTTKKDKPGKLPRIKKGADLSKPVTKERKAAPKKSTTKSYSKLTKTDAGRKASTKKNKN
ncbi:MAG: hypothetical protein K2W94_07830 [Alphaproteobacteria bacterium]|nr:hypothetical protein [Alphaproteobacteria bacterium]